MSTYFDLPIDQTQLEAAEGKAAPLPQTIEDAVALRGDLTYLDMVRFAGVCVMDSIAAVDGVVHHPRLKQPMMEGMNCPV